MKAKMFTFFRDKSVEKNGNEKYAQGNRRKSPICSMASQNWLICIFGAKCSKSESINLMPKTPITTKALVSKKGYFSIKTTKPWATNRMASMPKNTPIQIKIMLSEKATAAKHCLWKR